MNILGCLSHYSIAICPSIHLISLASLKSGMNTVVCLLSFKLFLYMKKILNKPRSLSFPQSENLVLPCSLIHSQINGFSSWYTESQLDTHSFPYSRGLMTSHHHCHTLDSIDPYTASWRSAGLHCFNSSWFYSQVQLFTLFQDDWTWHLLSHIQFSFKNPWGLM